MRCPKCDTTNSDFAVACLKCGYSFQRQATYEDFVPDYPVAPMQMPAPGQPGAPGGPSAYPGYVDPKVKKTKNIGMALLVVGIILIVIGAIMLLLMGATEDAKSPEELDDWAQTANIGDEIMVKGEIETETDILGARIYQFKDSNTQLTCSQDICNEGDTVTVKIERTLLGGFEIREQYGTTGGASIWIYLPLIILGIVLLLIGFLRVKKAKKMSTGQAPPPVPPQPVPGPAPAPAPAPGYPPAPVPGAPPVQAPAAAPPQPARPPVQQPGRPAPAPMPRPGAQPPQPQAGAVPQAAPGPVVAPPGQAPAPAPAPRPQQPQAPVQPQPQPQRVPPQQPR